MVNQGTILGRVGKINAKTMPNGNKVANLSIVTNKKYTDKSGQKQEKSTWHNVTFFGRLAEIAEQYVNVGEMLFVQGEMESQKYTGQDGIEKTKHFLLGTELKMLPKQKEQPKQTQQQQAMAHEFGSFPDENIPF